MSLAIPPYVPRTDNTAELEALRAQLAAAQKLIAERDGDIRDLVHNGEVVCQTMHKLALRLRDAKAPEIINQIQENFRSYLPKS